MKHLKIFENFINELFRHGDMDEDDDYGKTVVQFKSDMWVFNEDTYEQYADEMKAKLGISYCDDYYDFIQSVPEQKPYILVGTIETPYLNIIAKNNYRHSKASTDLHKVMKAFNLTQVRTEYADIINGEQDLYSFESPVKPKELANATFYHGTSVKFIDGIISKGLAPRDVTNASGNYGKIAHYDKIFITLNKERAYTHAINSAIKNGSYPILLELKVPDVKKLSLDYDVAIEFLNDDDRTEELGYSRIANNIGHSGDNVGIPNINDKLGVYSYIGRIPRNFIICARMETFTYDKFVLAKVYEDDSLFKIDDYDGESQDKIDHDVDTWQEFKLDELKPYFAKIQDEVQSQIDEENGDVDEDEDDYSEDEEEDEDYSDDEE